MIQVHNITIFLPERKPADAEVDAVVNIGLPLKKSTRDIKSHLAANLKNRNDTSLEQAARHRKCKSDFTPS